MFNCCIWDIKDLADNKVLIDLEINQDEFAVELYRDIRKFINNYHENHNIIPTSEEIKKAVEVDWLETKLWLETI